MIGGMGISSSIPGAYSVIVAPTIVAVTNCTITGSSDMFVQRSMNSVTCTGRVTISPEAIGEVQVLIVLPIPSSMTEDDDLIGFAINYTRTVNAIITPKLSDDSASLEFSAALTDVGVGIEYVYSFTYEVK